MRENIGFRCNMKLMIIKAKSEDEKRIIEELIRTKQYDKLQPYVIQENDWQEW